MNAVKEAVFVLLTEHGQGTLKALPADVSKEFQGKVEQLVVRCSSLLTIEHLMDLSREIQEEQKLKSNQLRDELLMALNIDSELDQSSEDSVELSLSPPVEDITQLEGWFMSDQVQESEDFYLSGVEAEEMIQNPDVIEDELVGNYSKKSTDDNQNLGESYRNDLDVLRSLFIMSSETMTNEQSKESDGNDFQYSNPGEIISEPKNQSNCGLMPDNPFGLSSWLGMFEGALERRLRNLSHALNVELLRVGVLNTLLPISLIDAVLRGQIEIQYSALNILKLRVPVQSPTFSEGIDVSCILLRSAQLEFDNPQLRQCRSQIKRHRTLLLKMVRQQRHWQSRSIAKELHQTWWQNPPEIQSKTPPRT